MLCVVAAASLWGILGVFSRSLGEAGLSPVQTTELRCLVAAVILLVLLAVFDRKLLKIEARDIWMFIGTGLLSISMFSILYFTAASLVTLSMAAVLLYTAPCFVMVMSVILFKESFTGRKAAALVLAFAGCILTAGIIGGSGPLNVLGIAAGIGSGFGYALYSIFGKYALRKYHPFTVTFYTFMVSCLCLLPVSDVPGIASAVSSSGGVVLDALALGTVSTLVPYFLYTYGLNRMDAGKAAVIAFVEPMVATLAGFVIFGETLTAAAVAGIVLILASVVLLNMGGREPRVSKK